MKPGLKFRFQIQSRGDSFFQMENQLKVRWEPEFAVCIIEAAVWGNTVETAAVNRTVDAAERADLPGISALVNDVLLAELPAAIGRVMQRLDEVAALSNDVVPEKPRMCRFPIFRLGSEAAR